MAYYGKRLHQTLEYITPLQYENVINDYTTMCVIIGITHSDARDRDVCDAGETVHEQTTAFLDMMLA